MHRPSIRALPQGALDGVDIAEIPRAGVLGGVDVGQLQVEHNRHGKFAGVPASPETVPALRQEGFQFLACGADVVGLCDYFRELSKALKACAHEGN